MKAEDGRQNPESRIQKIEDGIQNPEDRSQNEDGEMTLQEALVIVGRVALGIEEMGREMERCAERLMAQSEALEEVRGV